MFEVVLGIGLVLIGLFVIGFEDFKIWEKVGNLLLGYGKVFDSINSLLLLLILNYGFGGLLLIFGMEMVILGMYRLSRFGIVYSSMILRGGLNGRG